VLEFLTKEATKRYEGTQMSAFRATKIRWFLPHATQRNPFVPPFVPKRLHSGIYLEMNQHGLLAGFDQISSAGWFVYQENPLKVIPLTTENLEVVIHFFSEHLKRL